MNKKYLIIFLALIFSWPIASQAVLFSWTDSQSTLAINTDIEIALLVDPQGQNINALEGEIKLVPGLDLVDILDNKSIVSFWVEAPKLEKNSIYFSGIVPGGFTDKKELLTLKLRASSDLRADMILANVQAFLNDGLGSKASVELEAYTINFVANQAVVSTPPIIIDQEMPEDFTPIISRLDLIEENTFFLIFATKDKNSGIDYYEVREAWGRYEKATSPYRIKNQKLDGDIFIKAVDKAGNERVVKVLAFYPKAWYKKYEFYAIIITALIIFWLAYKYKRTHARKANKNKK